MNLAKKLLMATGEVAGGNIPSGGYVDDVFSTYLYTGNGSVQTINNGIDLAGEGGLVWCKQRNSENYHFLFDTVRGATKYLYSELADKQYTHVNSLIAFGNSGFTLGETHPNVNTDSYVSWTFRKAPKFFDVVTYTGNGVTGRQIAHSLGVQAGFITVKSTSAMGDWNSYHRSATGDLKLNLSDAQTASRTIITAADASTFTVSGTANTSGVSYVAYLWAHDPGADGIIQCGSFTGNTTVNIGWEPQWIMIKRTDGAGDWIVIDSMRGCSVGGVDTVLNPNRSNAEAIYNDYIDFTATGFITKNLNGTYVYTVVRRPNKPPTSGTQVYNASTASGVVIAGFPVDLHIGATRAGAASNHAMHARLTGGKRELATSSTAVEATTADLGFGSMTGLRASLSAGGVNHFFRRAPGFFDVVCYTGDGTVPQIVKHSLTVVPELVIIKNRSVASGQGWPVFYKGSLNNWLRLDTTQNASGAGYFTSLPTSTTLSLGYNLSGVSGIGNNYVAYLFASLPGISKVGSYSGNGSSQTIPCGFTMGSRFILIKRIDNTGDWFVWDTARGITPTTDPHLSLNTTAAEVTTDDSIDQDASGFIVNQNAATNINALGGNYLFLAIA